MKYTLTILFAFVHISVFAQRPTDDLLSKTVLDFNTALINKDTVSLNTLVSDNLNYGHSNGWVQTKRNLIDDLYNGKIVYKKINSSLQTTSLEGNVAWVRNITDLDVVLENKQMQFKLNVLQVWVWRNRHWELFARQSVKM